MEETLRRCQVWSARRANSLPEDNRFGFSQVSRKTIKTELAGGKGFFTGSAWNTVRTDTIVRTIVLENRIAR